MPLSQSSSHVTERNMNREDPSLGIGISTRVFSLDESLLDTDVDSLQEITESQLRLLGNFYNLALKQSSDSFKWALIAAGVGLVFLFAAIIFFFVTQAQDLSVISLISGAVVEVISAINFYLYNKTTAQLAKSQDRLDLTQRFLLAISISDRLEGEQKQNTLSEIIQALISNADNSPMQPLSPTIEQGGKYAKETHTT